MKKSLIFTAIAVLGLAFFAKAQDGNVENHAVTISVPEVALVDLESSSDIDISLSLTAPDEAGLGLTSSTNSDLWLNYSSIKSGANPTRTVTAKINQAKPGLRLKVAAADYSGSGEGDVGTSEGEIILTSSDQPLITDIGSCYTGNGTSNGHNLTYTLEATEDYAEISATDAASSYNVTYTISN